MPRTISEMPTPQRMRCGRLAVSVCTALSLILRRRVSGLVDLAVDVALRPRQPDEVRAQRDPRDAEGGPEVGERRISHVRTPAPVRSAAPRVRSGLARCG